MEFNMSGSVIKKCGCKGNPEHAASYQDKKYGQGMRVCNTDQKGGDATCTVCGKNHKV